MDYVVRFPVFDGGEYERAGVVLDGSEGLEDTEVGDGENDEDDEGEGL